MLGDIWQVKLDELSHERGLAEAEGKELKAAYKYLTQVIRNRDAHSYIENQRRQDFPELETILRTGVQHSRLGHEEKRALCEDWPPMTSPLKTSAGPRVCLSCRCGKGWPGEAQHTMET